MAVDDFSRLSLRDLLALARARLGTAASGLKTRAELRAALEASIDEAPQPDRSPESAVPLVTGDFFRRRD